MAKKLTAAKAREILHDKEVHGHPLTDKQRRFFGAISSGHAKYESGGWLDKYADGGEAKSTNMLPEVDVYGIQDRETRQMLNTLQGKPGISDFVSLPYPIRDSNKERANDMFQSWFDNGAPRIKQLDEKESASMGLPNYRPYFTPWDNSLHIANNNIDDYFAELAHAKQLKDALKSGESPAWAYDHKKYPTREQYDAHAYSDPLSGEYSAHKIIEPTLRWNYYKEGMLSNYDIEQYANSPVEISELPTEDQVKIMNLRTANFRKKNKLENGGQMNFLQPTSEKLPRGFKVPNRDFSTELAGAMTYDDKAYLIPTFKHGQPLEDPIKEWRQSKDILGGPFKDVEEANTWERDIRHPYVEKGQDIPTPLRRWGKNFEDGGQTYLGYDTTGRHYSPAWGGQFDEGGKLEAVRKYFGIPNMEELNTSVEKFNETTDVMKEKGLEAMDKVVFAPQRAIVEIATGKYQDPADALNIGEDHPWGRFWANALLDPLNIAGVGIMRKLSKLPKFGAAVKDLNMAVNDAVGIERASNAMKATQRTGEVFDKSAKTVIGNDAMKKWEKSNEEIVPIAENFMRGDSKQQKKKRALHQQAVTEHPTQDINAPLYFEQGGQLRRLDQLTNFTNYNKPSRGGWLDKYQ